MAAFALPVVLRALAAGVALTATGRLTMATAAVLAVIPGQR